MLLRELTNEGPVAKTTELSWFLLKRPATTFGDTKKEL
jgi:hypothetical protein